MTAKRIRPPQRGQVSTSMPKVRLSSSARGRLLPAAIRRVCHERSDFGAEQTSGTVDRFARWVAGARLWACRRGAPRERGMPGNSPLPLCRIPDQQRNQTDFDSGPPTPRNNVSVKDLTCVTWRGHGLEARAWPRRARAPLVSALQISRCRLFCETHVTRACIAVRVAACARERRLFNSSFHRNFNARVRRRRHGVSIT